MGLCFSKPRGGRRKRQDAMPEEIEEEEEAVVKEVLPESTLRPPPRPRVREEEAASSRRFEARQSAAAAAARSYYSAFSSFKDKIQPIGGGNGGHAAISPEVSEGGGASEVSEGFSVPNVDHSRRRQISPAAASAKSSRSSSWKRTVSGELCRDPAGRGGGADSSSPGRRTEACRVGRTMSARDPAAARNRPARGKGVPAGRSVSPATERGGGGGTRSASAPRASSGPRGSSRSPGRRGSTSAMDRQHLHHGSRLRAAADASKEDSSSVDNPLVSLECFIFL